MYKSWVIESIETSVLNSVQICLHNEYFLLGLKKHLTPILAGLLEVNQQKMWSFDKFFGEV